MFKSADERRARADAKSEAEKPKALEALKARRRWIIGQLRRDKIGLTGGALAAEADKHAQALFFVDHAIAILERDDESTEEA